MDANWLLKISPCIRVAGSATHSPRWVEAMRVIYEHELVLFEDAGYELEIEGEAFACPAGSFIIVPPGARHITREVSGQEGRRHWIHFDWIFSGAQSERPLMTYCPAKPERAFFRLAPKFVPSRIFHGGCRGFATALELAQRIEELFNSGSGQGRFLARACLLELLYELLSDEPEMRAGAVDSGSAAASATRALLAELASLPARAMPSVQDALAESGKSYAHLCRSFKKAYGISPLQYVAELRMTRIKAMLRDSSLGIAQIAELEGFDNMGYFARMFRKREGCSPRECRKRVRSLRG